MTDKTPKFWFELVGLAAVVGSLIFVGLELKQGQDVAIAGQYQDRASIVVDYFLTRLGSEQLISHHGDNLSESFEANLLGPQATEHYELRGPESLAINHLHLLVVLVMFDNLHFQFQHGFITEEAWIPFRSQLKGVLSTSLWAELFRQNTTRWRESFRNLCFELLAEIEAEKTSTGE